MINLKQMLTVSFQNETQIFLLTRDYNERKTILVKTSVKLVVLYLVSNISKEFIADLNIILNKS